MISGPWHGHRSEISRDDSGVQDTTSDFQSFLRQVRYYIFFSLPVVQNLEQDQSNFGISAAKVGD